jgi:hypothetical protein
MLAEDVFNLHRFIGKILGSRHWMIRLRLFNIKTVMVLFEK